MGNVPGVVLVVLAVLGATCGTRRGGPDLRPALTPTRAPNYAMSRTARVMPSCWLLAEGYHALAGLDGAGFMPQLRIRAGPNLQLRGGGVAESDGSDSDGDQGGEGGMSDGRGSGGSDKMDSDSASDAHVSGAGDAGSDAVTGEGGGKGGSSGLFVPPPPLHPDAEQDAAQFKPGMTRDMQVYTRILAVSVIYGSRLTMIHTNKPGCWPCELLLAPGLRTRYSRTPHSPPLADRPRKPRCPRPIRYVAARSPPPPICHFFNGQMISKLDGL